MKFADNLKKIRKSKNISQEELASKVGVSRQSVSKWETSEAYPEMNNILELCKIFHCHINDLVNDNSLKSVFPFVVDFDKNQLWICSSIACLAAAAHLGKIITIDEFKASTYQKRK